MQDGAEQLSNPELLAILLRVGVKGQDVVSLANQLLVRFGGASGLYRATWQDLADIHGMGEAKAVTIKAALELGRRVLQSEEKDRLQVRSPADVAALLQIEMGMLEQEHLRVVLLNTQESRPGRPRGLQGQR
jgi:DNA repair protein RadC